MPVCVAGSHFLRIHSPVDSVRNCQELEVAFKTLTEDTLGHPLDSVRVDIVCKLLEHGKEGTGQYFLFLAQTPKLARNAGATTALGSEPQPGNLISLVVALSCPLSTGSSHISSSDPSAKPIIGHLSLEKRLDLEMHSRHVRFLENITAAEPFASLLKPGERRNDSVAFLNGDLEKAKDYIAMAPRSNWNSVGTCAMAPKDKGGVVDEDLKVYGVKGLQAVDASVFPFIPQSNTQSLV